jgi:hypothetical protein
MKKNTEKKLGREIMRELLMRFAIGIVVEILFLVAVAGYHNLA